MVLTSPNQDWVLDHPVERHVIHTYQDGLWGVLEYSRWPQPFVRNMWHMPCTPPPLDNSSVIPIIPHYCFRADIDWEEQPAVGYPGLGFLKPRGRDQLKRAAQGAASRFRGVCNIPEHGRVYGESLDLMGGQCTERLAMRPTSAVWTAEDYALMQREATNF